MAFDICFTDVLFLCVGLTFSFLSILSVFLPSSSFSVFSGLHLVIVAYLGIIHIV